MQALPYGIKSYLWLGSRVPPVPQESVVKAGHQPQPPLQNGLFLRLGQFLKKFSLILPSFFVTSFYLLTKRAEKLTRAVNKRHFLACVPSCDIRLDKSQVSVGTRRPFGCPVRVQWQNDPDIWNRRHFGHNSWNKRPIKNARPLLN